MPHDAVPDLAGASRSRRSAPPRVLVWAHRGASRDAPANTCEAALRAREQGADGVEVDLQLCATGEVVVFHDTSLAAYGLRRPLRQLSLSALRTFDLGGGARIPTLEELLSAAGDDLRVNLELKSHRVISEGLEPAVARVLTRTGFPVERVLLSSFNPLSLWRAGRLLPRVPKAWLLHAGQSALWRSAWPRLLRTVPGFVALHPEHVMVEATLVRAAHDAGLRIQPWTVDAVDDLARLIALHVDGIITNRPGRVRALLASALRAR